MNIPDFMEIKHPLFNATKGDCFTVWEVLDDGTVFGFDYLPVNYPSFVVFSFKSEKLAKKRAKEMLKEGWELVEENWD